MKKNANLVLPPAASRVAVVNEAEFQTVVKDPVTGKVKYREMVRA